MEKRARTLLISGEAIWNKKKQPPLALCHIFSLTWSDFHFSLFNIVYAVSPAHCSKHSFSPITCLYLSLCVVWVRGRENKDVSVELCVFFYLCVSCVPLILLLLFPLQISCIIYVPLMNMLISRRAGRGERASPVLFLHSSDERGMEKEEAGKRLLLLERKSGEIHLWNPRRSANKRHGNMDRGEPMLCYIVLETNESPMLRRDWKT